MFRRLDSESNANHALVLFITRQNPLLDRDANSATIWRIIWLTDSYTYWPVSLEKSPVL